MPKTPRLRPIHPQISHNPYSRKRGLLVNAVLPHLLLVPGAIRARAQDALHLRDADEHDLARDEPADALVARRAGQAALVRPELVEPHGADEGRAQVHGDVLPVLRLVEPDHGRQLREEGVLRVARVQAEGQHRLLVALGVDVYEVHLGLGPHAADRVVGRRVDVPALQVHGLVVVGEGRVFGPHAVGVAEDERRAVVPVVEGAGDAVRVGKFGPVVQRESVGQAEGNGGLLRAGLAQLVVWDGGISSRVVDTGRLVNSYPGSAGPS